VGATEGVNTNAIDCLTQQPTFPRNYPIIHVHNHYKLLNCLFFPTLCRSRISTRLWRVFLLIIGRQCLSRRLVTILYDHAHLFRGWGGDPIENNLSLRAQIAMRTLLRILFSIDFYRSKFNLFFFVCVCVCFFFL
jgi:hypothetical protein